MSSAQDGVTGTGMTRRYRAESGFRGGLSYFLFLPCYPLWSVVLTGVDIFVIGALAASIGRDAAR